MTDYVIPCDTFYRISRVAATRDDEIHPSWSSMRIDDGCLIASDRSFMAVENYTAHQKGVAHLNIDPALIEQCRTEAKFNGRVTVTVNEILKYAQAKTTFGYVTKENLLYTADLDPDWDRWREIINKAREPATKPNGVMFWHADNIQRLAESSPSGRVVFESVIDTSRPTLLRDVTDYHWLGIFQARSRYEQYSPATVPTWI